MRNLMAAHFGCFNKCSVPSGILDPATDKTESATLAGGFAPAGIEALGTKVMLYASALLQLPSSSGEEPGSRCKGRA